MKDTTSSRKPPTYQSVAAEPVASATPAEISVRPNRVDCSPRASIAFATLDVVRSIISFLGGFVWMCKTKASTTKGHLIRQSPEHRAVER